MKKNLLVYSLAALLMFSNAAFAKKHKAPADAPSSEASTTSTLKVGPGLNRADVNKLLDSVQAKNPAMQKSLITNVDKAPMAGFYQIMANGDVYYISKDGSTMIVGDVISLDKKLNFTEGVRKDARLALVNSVPEKDMVVFNPSKKTEHTVTVFTDIDCGYCRKFHKEMQSYLDQGIKVRYIAFPRAGKNSESYNKIVTVWCSKDRNKAMNEAKLTEAFKSAPLCEQSKVVDHQLELVAKLGLRGTPALVFDDGTLMPGYMPADKLKAALDNEKKNKTANSEAFTHSNS